MRLQIAKVNRQQSDLNDPEGKDHLECKDIPFPLGFANQKQVHK
jgi:hypothetical protein